MPRPIQDQVVVVTGASSGIGLATALELGRRGAAVVLSARPTTALQEALVAVRATGAQAEAVPADVAEWEQVQALAERAVERFGRIDTWVNDAGIGLHGTVEETDVEEIERLIRVDLLGTIHGIKAALPHLRRQDDGTIVNVASVEALRAMPLHAAYAAAKHGVRGFVESLRVELAHEGSGVKVVLVHPASINTPFFDQARSKMGVAGRPLPPAYPGEVVAEAIVHVAEHPQREVIVGGAGQTISMLQRLSPALLDRLLLTRGFGVRIQQDRAPDHGPDNLYSPIDRPAVVAGRFGRRTLRRSAYTTALGLHPGRGRVLAAGALAAGVAAIRRR